jgi:heptosyltransferase-2
MNLKKILIIRLSAIGDILLTTPVIRVLKNSFPGIKIDFLVKEKFAPLIETNRHLNEIVKLVPTNNKFDIGHLIQEIRSKEYDGLVDLQSNFRSYLLYIFSNIDSKVRFKHHRLERFFLVHFGWNLYNEIKPVPFRYLNAISSWGMEDDGLGLELNIDKEADRSISIRFRDNKLDEQKSLIVLAPGASRSTKRWPAYRFGEIGKYFSQKNAQIALVGGKFDIDVCKEVVKNMDDNVWDFSGQLSLQETAAVVKRADLLITNDTGVMHIGAATGRRIVAIFGPTTNHLGFMPFRTSSVVVEKELNCRPCSFHGTDRCPKGHFRCMQEIISNDVIRAAEDIIRKS